MVKTTCSFLLLSSLLAATASAFTVAPPSPSIHSLSTTRVFSEPPQATEEPEEDGLDLDLGEMFSMFDAADKEQDFDDALKKVKGSK
jgi:hypothetical protein